MGRTQSGLPGAGLLAKYLRVLSRGKEDNTLLEADPVGDFLARKQAGVVDPEVEGVKPDLPPVLAGLDTDLGDGDLSDTALEPQDRARDIEEASVQEISGSTGEEDMPSPVSEEPAPHEDNIEEDASQMESEDAVQRVPPEIVVTPEKDESDESVKGLLDIFKNEQLPESPISTLSKDLTETNIYSLLKETKEVAQKFRRTANLYQIGADFDTEDE